MTRFCGGRCEEDAESRLTCGAEQVAVPRLSISEKKSSPSCSVVLRARFSEAANQLQRAREQVKKKRSHRERPVDRSLIPTYK